MIYNCMLTKDKREGSLRAVVREPLACETLLLLCDEMGWDVAAADGSQRGRRSFKLDETKYGIH